MEKKFKTETFSNYSYSFAEAPVLKGNAHEHLQSFINENKITQEQIVSILYNPSGGSIILCYFE